MGVGRGVGRGLVSEGGEGEVGGGEGGILSGVVVVW